MQEKGKKSKRRAAVAVQKLKERRPKRKIESVDVPNAPFSIVVYRDKVGRPLKTLMKEFRMVMQPNTASSLQVKKCNVMKDYIAFARYFSVSHLCMFTHTKQSPYMKIGRISQGPTLTFQIHNYALATSVIASQKHHPINEKQFKTHPLLVLNNFSGEGLEMQLMASMFQSLFTSINVAKVKLNDIHRCVMLNYNSEDKTIDFRHYSIRMIPQEVSKGVKKLIQTRIPDLSKFNDISEFITKSGNLSESEAEDDPASHVTLPQDLNSRGNRALQKSAVRLVELGPRMTLQLIKIENSFFRGDVLFHEYVHKTEEEKEEFETRVKQKRLMKEQRKKQQEINVQKKKAQKEILKQKSLEGMKRKLEENKDEEEEANIDDVDDEEDDDAEWYRKEVGEEPDEELFASHKRKREASYVRKRMRTSAPMTNEKKWNKSVERKIREAGLEKTDEGKRNKFLQIKMGKKMKNKMESKVKNRFQNKNKFSNNVRKKRFDAKGSSNKHKRSNKKS